jgi:hypothetical protein
VFAFEIVPVEASTDIIDQIAANDDVFVLSPISAIFN